MSVRMNLVEALSPLSLTKGRECLGEWYLYAVDEVENYGDAICICEHPIKFQYYIKNSVNGNEAVVGSCCVKNIGAKHLLLHWRSQMNYLESAKIMDKHYGTQSFIDGLIAKYKVYGSRNKVSKVQAVELERITGRKWRWGIWQN